MKLTKIKSKKGFFVAFLNAAVTDNAVVRGEKSFSCSLAKGSYIVKVIADNQTTVQKIMIK